MRYFKLKSKYVELDYVKYYKIADRKIFVFDERDKRWYISGRFYFTDNESLINKSDEIPESEIVLISWA